MYVVNGFLPPSLHILHPVYFLFFSFSDGTFKFYSLRKFQFYAAVLSTIVTVCLLIFLR